MWLRWEGGGGPRCQQQCTPDRWGVVNVVTTSAGISSQKSLDLKLSSAELWRDAARVPRANTGPVPSHTAAHPKVSRVAELGSELKKHAPNPSDITDITHRGGCTQYPRHESWSGLQADPLGRRGHLQSLPRLRAQDRGRTGDKMYIPAGDRQQRSMSAKCFAENLERYWS